MLVSPSQLQPAADTARPFLGHLRVVGRRRVAVVLNANAKRVTRKVRDRFAQAVPEEDLFFSRSLEEAESFARTIIDRRYDTVLAGGGDGTIVNTMNMLLRAAEAQSSGLYRPPLPDIGVLRLGTGNGLGYATGAGKPMDDVLEVLSGRVPQARPLQLMEDADGKAIFPFASLGYDAQLLNDYMGMVKAADTPMAHALMKTLAGYFVALGLRTIPQQLRARTPEIRLVATGRVSKIDPETDEEIPLANGSTIYEGTARAVAMGTTPYYGYNLKVFPFADRRSDRFHVRVSNASIPFVLGHLPSLWNGSLRTPMIQDFLVEGVRIESSEELPYQTSGDARGYRRSLEVNLSPRTFRVLDKRPTV